MASAQTNSLPTWKVMVIGVGKKRGRKEEGKVGVLPDGEHSKLKGCWYEHWRCARARSPVRSPVS